MVRTEPLTLTISVIFKKTVFLRILSPAFVKRNRRKMTNRKKTVVYIGLQDIENNGFSDWLEKESTHLVTRSLASQTRKLQFID